MGVKPCLALKEDSSLSGCFREYLGTREKVIGTWRSAMLYSSSHRIIRSVKKRWVGVAHTGECIHHFGQKTCRKRSKETSA
jgi:hypothetical protein